jgi:hypothetical protein
MRFSIGGAFAKCGACQGEDFYPAFPLTPDRRDVVICARCDSQAIYAELVKLTRRSPEPKEKNKWTPTRIPTKTGLPRRSRTR